MRLEDRVAALEDRLATLETHLAILAHVLVRRGTITIDDAREVHGLLPFELADADD
jgi:uncharacterized coiled-coil protein SlyX